MTATWPKQMDTHVGYIPVWIKKLEGRIIAIGVYDKQSYRLVGKVNFIFNRNI
jgi:hypothetical protein